MEPDTYPGCFSSIVLSWCTIGIFLGIAGCGPSVSTEVRTAYSLEFARCTANELEIIERAGTTEAEDVNAMAEERRRCDHALADILHETDGGAP